ncbi:hypothetical protein EBX31_04800 [bacterium]|nr:hypothetical protein [bacterium]
MGLDDLVTCSTCEIRVSAPQAGSLQLLTRRTQGGAGDGVSVEEATSIAADYRGQRYSFQEAVLHVPGLHVFPGQTEAYPAEYHIHMTTFSAPRRSLTLVLPVSHLVTGPGQEYFAAMAAQPDPAVTRPTLEALLTPGAPMIQYQGPDIRGRTRDTPTPEGACDADGPADERQFLLVLAPCQIRAADLERIPREGSASSDPRDLPAPGVAPSQGLTRDRLRRTAVLARPGLAGGTLKTTSTDGSGAPMELQCLPLEVVDGKDVIVDGSGQAIPLNQLLGGSAGGKGMFGGMATAPTQTQNGLTPLEQFVRYSVKFIMIITGLLIADYLVGFLWGIWFKNARARAWEPLKLVALLLLAITMAATPESALEGWIL